MKQGKHYLSIVIWIFLAAIVAYFGYNLATSLYTPLTTTTAVEYEAGAGYYATGFVARDESVIRSNYAISVLTVSEGSARGGGRPGGDRLPHRRCAGTAEPHPGADRTSSRSSAMPGSIRRASTTRPSWTSRSRKPDLAEPVRLPP